MSTITVCDGDCEGAGALIGSPHLFASGMLKVLVKEGADDAHLRIRTDESSFHLCESCTQKAFGAIGIATERIFIGPEFAIS